MDSDNSYFSDVLESVLSENCIFSILVKVSEPSSVKPSDGEV